MKKDFWDYMLKVMDENPNIYIVSVGLGWPRTDEFATKYPDRFVQTEASEQAALDIAVGLAYAGKIPFVYTITPFYLRAWETIRTYMNHESLHTVLIGAGRDDDYSKHDGFSHDAYDIRDHFNLMTNFAQRYPKTVEQLHNNIDATIRRAGPTFISIIK